MELNILITTILLCTASLAAAAFCFYKQRKNFALIEFAFKQVDDLETSLAASKEELEAVVQRATDQSCRVAWLETRIRQPKLAKKDILDEELLNEKSNVSAKSNITERRHRVLSLANIGQNAETIAETLGMLPGEVELIINLSRGNFMKFA